MSLSFCSFASGSSGNCYLVKTESTSVIIDAGISAKRIREGLARTNTPEESVAALLVTHEHSDHVSGLGPATNALKTAEVVASAGTFANLRGGAVNIPSGRKHIVSAGNRLTAGDIEISVFGLRHDAAEPTGFTLTSSSGSVSIVTDTGALTEEILSAVCDSDLIALEANHDVEMLKHGRYPAFLKQRILGESGHLSNAQAANAVCEIMNMDKKPRCILLSHLSRDNNHPQLAEKTVADILGEMGWYSGRDLFLKPLLRDRMSVVFEI
ncbi:MAG: MBL fold metallo-hydrolase [Clostridiales Family XIII bacterium]|jgi:phosphoribosyl 1,2-cyclic phosphodiesterase|nr:MBL fold metallo-hydrolase [Clostridiales Family XIII bacterium]